MADKGEKDSKEPEKTSDEELTAEQLNKVAGAMASKNGFYLNKI